VSLATELKMRRDCCRLGETDHVVFQFVDRDITDSTQ
jgi:hypothetical protein